MVYISYCESLGFIGRKENLGISLEETAIDFPVNLDFYDPFLRKKLKELLKKKNIIRILQFLRQ